jgi:hypothetical protein
MPALESKAASRIALNTSLLSVAVGIFFLVVSLRSQLLVPEVVAAQMVLPIPLLLSSILAYSKVGYKDRIERWDTLGWITFILGYAMILNVVGILLAGYVSLRMSLLFFGASWTMTIVYSVVDISYERSHVRERLAKDALFIVTQLLFGVLVVLGAS